MPIPTRSMSLREPREPRKPISGIARPVAKTTSKISTRPIASNEKVQSGNSPIDGTKDITSSRGRTLLPQRSNSSRDESQSHGQSSIQPSERGAAQRGERSPARRPKISDEKQPPATKKTTTATADSVPTRRQSLIRPGTSRLNPISTSSKANVSASTKSATSMAPPPSPRKQPINRTPIQSTARPASPKKTDMPPPARPMRSASLRQPVNTTRPGVEASVPARGHARHRSQMTPATATKIQGDSAKAATAQKAKPQFSAYQQHYSPQKPGAKPPTPTPGATSGSTSDSLLIPASWPDIAALQTELLQLSLFHSNSLQKQADWKEESESCLRKKYDAVAYQYRSLLGDEKERQTQINMQALWVWLRDCEDHHGPGNFPEQIQSLSQILQEVSDLSAHGMNGRYTLAVQTFEAWFHNAEQIRCNRASSDITNAAVFIDPLNRAWKEELQSLRAKLDLCLRQLGSLDVFAFAGIEGLEQAALARVAQSLHESIQLMIQEIQAMRTAETEIIRLERETVGRLATEVASLPRRESRPRIGLWMS